jgi:hypothetical protein
VWGAAAVGLLWLLPLLLLCLLLLRLLLQLLLPWLQLLLAWLQLLLLLCLLQLSAAAAIPNSAAHGHSSRPAARGSGRVARSGRSGGAIVTGVRAHGPCSAALEWSCNACATRTRFLKHSRVRSARSCGLAPIVAELAVGPTTGLAVGPATGLAVGHVMNDGY